MDMKLICCDDLKMDNIDDHDAIQLRIESLMDSLVEKDVQHIVKQIKKKEKRDCHLFVNGKIKRRGDYEWNTWGTYPSLPSLFVGEAFNFNSFNNVTHTQQPPQTYFIFKTPPPNPHKASVIYNNCYRRQRTFRKLKSKSIGTPFIADTDASDTQSDTISSDGLNIESDLMDNISDSSSRDDSINYSISPSCDSYQEDKEVVFINKYSEINVNDLVGDLQNGLILAQILDTLEEGVIDWKKIKKNCVNKFDKIVNCDYLIDIMKNKLGVNCCGIVGTDIVSGNEKCIRTLIWRLKVFYKSYV